MIKAVKNNERKLGRLHVSVIEARDVVGDSLADPSFYVRLKHGADEARTTISHESFCPKFMKDFRFDVEDVSCSILRLEFLQVGMRGDLVVGSKDIPTSALVGKGTIIKWISVHSTSKSTGADICVVMKYVGPKQKGSKGGKLTKEQLKKADLSRQRQEGAKDGGMWWLNLPELTQPWVATGVALLGGVIAGAALFSRARRPVRKLRSLGNNCTIAACVYDGYEEIYRKNLNVVSYPSKPAVPASKS